jgi:hypothetical protein
MTGRFGERAACPSRTDPELTRYKDGTTLSFAHESHRETGVVVVGLFTVPHHIAESGSGAYG